MIRYSIELIFLQDVDITNCFRLITFFRYLTFLKTWICFLRMPQKLKNLHCRFDTYLVNVKSTVHCSEDLVNFCGLLRKHEVYYLFLIFYFDFELESIIAWYIFKILCPFAFHCILGILYQTRKLKEICFQYNLDWKTNLK